MSAFIRRNMLNSPLLIKGSTRKGEGLENISLEYQHNKTTPYTELTLKYLNLLRLNE